MSRSRPFVFLLVLVLSRAAAEAELRWTTDGPSNSIVSQIAVDPQTSGTVYAIADERVCKRTDGGRIWSILISGYFSTAFAIAVDPTRSGRIFVGTFGGVFVSSDGGASWEARGLKGVSQSRIWIDPSQPNTVYAFGSSGFFRTLDGGLNWTRPNLPRSLLFRFAFAVGSDGTDFVWFSSGEVFRSRDGGESWVLASSSPPFSDVRAIVPDPTTPAVLYALAPGGLFRSADGGSSWEPRGGGSALSLAFDPRDAAVLYAGAVGGVWKSADAGRTWQPIGVHPPFSATASVVALAVDPQTSTTIYSGTLNSSGDFDEGFYRSEDGGTTWDRSNKGLPGVGVVAFAADPSSPAVIYAATSYPGTGSVYKSRDSGASWEKTGPRDLPNASALAIDPVNPATLYVGTSVYPPQGSWQRQGEVRKSTDGGLSWTMLLEYGGIAALAVDPRDPNRIFLSVSCINLDVGPCSPPLQSADGGATWQELGHPPGIIGQFVFDPMIRGTVYALAWHICTDCFPAFITTVFKTTDGGVSWSPANSGLPATGFGNTASVLKLVLDTKSPGTVYAASQAGLFRTRDGGVSWSVTGLSVSAKDVAIDPWDSSVLYAATDGGGVLRSLDGGSNWQPINTGLPDLSAQRLVIDSAGTFLHTTTSVCGVYDLQLPRPIKAVGPRRGPQAIKPRT